MTISQPIILKEFTCSVTSAIFNEVILVDELHGRVGWVWEKKHVTMRYYFDIKLELYQGDITRNELTAHLSALKHQIYSKKDILYVDGHLVDSQKKMTLRSENALNVLRCLQKIFFKVLSMRPCAAKTYECYLPKIQEFAKKIIESNPSEKINLIPLEVLGEILFRVKCIKIGKQDNYDSLRVVHKLGLLSKKWYNASRYAMIRVLNTCHPLGPHFHRNFRPLLASITRNPHVSLLKIACFASNKEFNDDDLQQLSNKCPNIIALNVTKTQVTVIALDRFKQAHQQCTCYG